MKNKRELGQAILGIIVVIISLIYAVSLLRERLSFFQGAKVYNATIVEVAPQGERRKGWTGWEWHTIYIPIVEIMDENGVKVKMRVDDYSSSPVYRIGDKLDVLCNRAVSYECIVNTFSETWGDVLYAWVFPLVILSFTLRQFRHYLKFYRSKDNLYDYKRGLDTFQKRSLELSKNPLATVKKRLSPFKRKRKKR